MYERYWNLERPAFQCAHDASGFFPSRTHQSSLLKLQYLVERKLSAALLIGGHGLGKTYLTRVFESQLEAPAGPVARLVFPQMLPAELLAYLAGKLGAETGDASAPLSTDRVLRMLEQRLSQLAADGRHPILVVDDAQILTPDHFQILHLLLNVTREAKAHFSLILVGEPDLLPKVQRIGALDDRIEVRTTLRPFTPEETRAYVLDRMFAAGRSTDVFSPDAFEALWETSQGIPRKINQLCELALLVGYADSLTSVTSVEIEAAADELTSVAVD